MLRNWRFISTVLLALVAVLVGLANARSRDKDTLQSFYVARFYFSDDLSASSDSILDVTPQGDDVRVRLIRLSEANQFCPGVVVRAVDHVFHHSSVRKIAGIDICAFTPDAVESALSSAKPKYAGDYSDSATETIVANCSTGQKEFDFPYPVEIDQKRLERSDPSVSKLWDTSYRIWHHVFRNNFSFTARTPDQEREWDELGTQLVPLLTSGKYQAAFAGNKCGDHDCDNYLAWWLKGYTQAPKPYDPLVATLLDPDSFHFIKYIAPIVPMIAATAHVYGDVRLRISADQQDGTVIDVQAISGPPLLQRAAVTAARSWKFAPGSLFGQPLDATLRFQLRCQ